MRFDSENLERAFYASPGRARWHAGLSILVLTLAALMPSPLQAVEYEPIKDPFRERFILHVNGLSYHLGGSGNDLNELNWGVGFGYDFGRLSSGSRILNEAVVSLNADLYSDSFAEFGYAFGVSIQNKLVGPIDLGLHAGFVHENNIVNKGGLYLFPFLVPFLETTFDYPVNCRLTIVPPLSGFSNGLLTFQALVRF